MATPIFDAISVEVSKRMSDAVAAAATDGKWLTAAVRNAYVNKALNKFFADMLKLTGNKDLMAKLFPELVVKRDVTLTYAGGLTTYTKATPNLDMFGILNAFMVSVSLTRYLRIWDEKLFSTVMTDDNPDYETTSAEPALIYMGNIVYVFPKGIGESVTWTLTMVILKKPVDPTTGGFLTQGGSYDSPFDTHWNSHIAEIAEQLIRTDAQSDS